MGETVDGYVVMGIAGETAPVQLLRQAQNPAALRLFVDLYHSHGLAEDGGVRWRRIRQDYTRHKIGERGPFGLCNGRAGTAGGLNDLLVRWPELTKRAFL